MGSGSLGLMDGVGAVFVMSVGWRHTGSLIGVLRCMYVSVRRQLWNIESVDKEWTYVFSVGHDCESRDERKWEYGEERY